MALSLANTFQSFQNSYMLDKLVLFDCFFLRKLSRLSILIENLYYVNSKESFF